MRYRYEKLKYGTRLFDRYTNFDIYLSSSESDEGFFLRAINRLNDKNLKGLVSDHRYKSMYNKIFEKFFKSQL